MLSRLFVLVVVAAAAQPHICYVLIDDTGFNDIGYRNGTTDIESPHMDDLASSGVKLEQFYTQLVCSPSRGAIMTGKYPFRLGLSHGFIAAGAPYGLPLNERTMAQELSDAGYSTHAIGKWHLGMAKWAYTPSYRGFDTHFGFYNGAVHYWAHTHPEQHASSPLDYHRIDKPGVPSTPVTDLNGTATHNISEYGPFVYARETVRVIEAHASRNDARPMFIYLAHQSTHEPIDAPASYVDHFASKITDLERRTFAGMILALDDSIKTVTDALKAVGYWENTLFVLHRCMLFVLLCSPLFSFVWCFVLFRWCLLLGACWLLGHTCNHCHCIEWCVI
jgi:arylsulfatase B/arylsulfatase I/J